MGFLAWHYSTGLVLLFSLGGNFSAYLFHTFSFGVLLSTLFAPWKRTYFVKEKLGFDLGEVFSRWVGNLFSSFLGFMVRSFLIFLCLFLQFWLWVVWLSVVIVWLICPPVSWFWYWCFREQRIRNDEEVIISGEGNLLGVVKEIVNDNEFKFVTRRLGLDWEVIKKIDFNLSGFKGLVGRRVRLSDLVKWLWMSEPTLARYLEQVGGTEADLVSIISWYGRVDDLEKKRREFWRKENLMTGPGIADDLAYGYAPTLEKYSVLMSDPKRFFKNLVGRGKVVSEMERSLIKTEGGNVLLSGEPGVGKKTVIFELAKRIYEGKSTAPLARMRLFQLDIATLVAKAGPFDAKAILKRVFEEAAMAGNVILVIDSFDQYISSGEGRFDFSEVFLQQLSLAKVKLIGILTPEAYQKYIVANSVIRNLFDLVEVLPPLKDEAMVICQDFVLGLERERKLMVTEQAIRRAVEEVDKLITEVPFPEKAVDLLDEVVVYAIQVAKIGVVTPKEVDTVLSEKLNIPLGELEVTEVDRLKRFEELIHERIIGQNEAVAELAMALRRTRLSVTKNKNLGAFLFLGPTGVGKTETAKVLAEAYFGSSLSMDRLDMAEFVGDEAIERLIGSVRTKDPGVLVRMLREKPYGVLLVDELEKAPLAIMNLFLTVLDEGYLTDAWGRKVSVSNKIIIATTNAGSEYIRQKVMAGVAYEVLRDGLIEQVLSERIFSPEFINRFDSAVVYRPLLKEDLKQIAILWLKGFNASLFKERGIKVKTTDSLLEVLVREGYDPAFGARYMRRAFARIVEDFVAKRILYGEVVKGQEIEVAVV
jgi:ATP-dependent Clp protease ATP-binding subunit ClpC